MSHYGLRTIKETWNYSGTPHQVRQLEGNQKETNNSIRSSTERHAYSRSYLQPTSETPTDTRADALSFML